MLPPGSYTVSWVTESFVGDFFFFWANRVGSNLHSALIRLIHWQRNKSYFLGLHRECPDPDGGHGTLPGSDKGGQGTQMTRLESRKCLREMRKLFRAGEVSAKEEESDGWE